MSDESIADEEEVQTLIIIPPDGGWGYVVIISSFICLFIIEGTCNTFGIFLESLSQSFGTNMADTSLIGSTLTCLSAMVGPFVSACLNFYDCRCVCITGCVLSGIAYAIAAITTNYYVLFAVNGVLLGIGYGMLYIPAIIMPSIYFVRYRALAVSFATCGSGIGTLAVPNAATIIIEKFGWRITYFCMIGLIGVAAFASLAYIPLEPVVIKSKRLSQMTAMKSKVQLTSEKTRCCQCWRWGNRYFPTAEDIMLVEKGEIQHISTDPFEATKIEGVTTSDTPINFSRGAFLSSLSMTFNRAYICWYTFLSCFCSECCQTGQRLMYRQDIFYQGTMHAVQKYRQSALYSRRRIEKKKIKKLRQEQLKEELEKKREERVQLERDKKKLQDDRAKVVKERLRIQGEIEKLGPPSGMQDKRTMSIRIVNLEKVRQLRILEKKIDQEIKNIVEVLEKPVPSTSSAVEKEEKNKDLMKYHMSITHVTTNRELYEARRCSCNLATIRALTTLLDCHVLHSIAFIIICFNAFFFNLGYYIPLIFVAERAQEHGTPKDQAVAFLALIGGANTIGRLLSGVVAMKTHTNYALLIGVCCVLQGAVTTVSGFFMETWAQIIYVVSYGFLAAPMLALRSLMIVELFGIEHLSNLYGIQLVGTGLAALLGPPLAGFIRDSTSNFCYSFYLAGGCIILSALLLFIIHPVRQWEVKKEIVDF